MADNKDDRTNDDVASTQVLGLGGVKPDSAKTGDRARDPEPREGVGAAGEVERIAGTSSVQPSKGATGIDMGAGGDGTDIKP